MRHETIGTIRRALMMPFACKWNSWVRTATAMLGCLALLIGCNFTEGLAAASSTLKELEPGFDKFAWDVKDKVKKAIVKVDQKRWICESKLPAVNVKKCMGPWWLIDRDLAPKMRRVVEKLPDGAGLGPEALDAVYEAVGLLAKIDGLRG